jgi:CRP-like cAMP-binding protein
MTDTPHPLIPRLTCRPDQVVFRQGDPGHEAYIVEDGEIAIERTVGGRRERLGSIVKGGMFGELALIDGQPRMADAVAARDTTLLVVRRDTFLTKFEAADPFMKALVRFLVRNVRSLANRDAT